MESRQLSWLTCNPDSVTGVAAPSIGGAALTDAEVSMVRDALSQVRVSWAMQCGADAAALTLDLTTARGIERYADDFYASCPYEVLLDREFVSGLDPLGVVLAGLVR
jgi:hypothetical protein